MFVDPDLVAQVMDELMPQIEAELPANEDEVAPPPEVPSRSPFSKGTEGSNEAKA